MIVIAGDSWGCGEWYNHTISHKGLEKYLKECGYSVVNLSKGNSSNYDTYNRLETFLASEILKYFDEENSILVFQTTWERDHRVTNCTGKQIWDLPGFSQRIIDDTVDRWYRDLSNLSQKFQITINIIGGCSDTVPLKNFTSQYTGLNILCQSLTNYLCNNDPFVQDPVFGIYNHHMISTFENFHNIDKNFLITELDRGEQRLKMWRELPALFWPDWVHPNRHGHKKLFEYLQKIGYLK